MEILKKLRLERGLSQEELAEKLSVSFYTIYKYENGIIEPDISMLIKIAKFFNVSIDYLINYSEYRNVLEDVSELSISELDFIRHYRKIPQELKDKLYDIMNYFLENIK